MNWMMFSVKGWPTHKNVEQVGVLVNFGPGSSRMIGGTTCGPAVVAVAGSMPGIGQSWQPVAA